MAWNHAYLCMLVVVLPEFANAINEGEGWKIGVIIGTTIGALVFAFIVLFLVYYLFVKKYLQKLPPRYYDDHQSPTYKKAPLYQLDAEYLPPKDYRQQARVEMPEARPSSLPDYGRSSVVVAGPTGGSMTVLDQYDREPGSHNHSMQTTSSYGSQGQPQGQYSNLPTPTPTTHIQYSNPPSNTPQYTNLEAPPVNRNSQQFNSQAQAPVITDSPSYSSQIVQSPAVNQYTSSYSYSANPTNTGYSYGQVRAYRETTTTQQTRQSQASYQGSSV